MNRAHLITPDAFGGDLKQFPGIITAAGPRVQNGDWLALTLTTSDATGTVRLTARLLRDDGEIVVTTELMTFSGTGTQTAVVARLSDGWLQGFDVSVASGTITDGEVVAAVHLGTGEGSLRSYQCCLASGEITNIRSLGLGAFTSSFSPQVVTESPTIVTATSAPAAGADYTFTVAAGQTWQIQSLRAALTTSAAVANRHPYLTIDDGANALLYIPNITAVTASLTRDFNYSNFGTTWTSADSSEYQIALPPLFLTAGSRIRAITVNLQAADQWSGVYLTYRQY